MPNAPVRALVVDDSVVIRRLVSQVLGDDPGIEVVGAAANGQIALKLISLLKPDVVTLDIEMPEMDGLETLRHIRKLYPDLIVIMFSTLSERGAKITMEALSLGANDYVAKAIQASSFESSVERLRADLVPKIHQFFGARPAAAKAIAPPAQPSAPKNHLQTRKVVAIGISTGGPQALAHMIPALPADFKAPVLIVQHMPPIFTRLLSERLQTLTKLRVREAVDGMAVDGGTIYVAPGDFHMRVVRQGDGNRLRLDQAEQENFCRPAADVLFRSVAEVYGGAVVSVIMTGMGTDGCRGIGRLREEGAWVIAQDEASSVVWGMPGTVVKAGLADVVVDLSKIAGEITRQF